MTDFTITITDEAKLFAIESLVDRKNEGVTDPSELIDAAGYLQMIIDRASESWVREFPLPNKAVYQAALEELAKAKLLATGKAATDIAAAEAALLSINQVDDTKEARQAARAAKRAAAEAALAANTPA